MVAAAQIAVAVVDVVLLVPAAFWAGMVWVFALSSDGPRWEMLYAAVSSMSLPASLVVSAIAVWFVAADPPGPASSASPACPS
ncbi:hypothetical protein HK405_001374 [Cladochytrium tenue]|nr:hypothetical protein HK405_001374 [Cladochytrium tenue]